MERCETDDKGEEHIRAAKLNLVDLAGSERQGKTGGSVMCDRWTSEGSFFCILLFSGSPSLPFPYNSVKTNARETHVHRFYQTKLIM
jgi:hypothetical protein